MKRTCSRWAEGGVGRCSSKPIALTALAPRQVEQDFELASNDYEHFNNLIKQELPHFFQMATKFVDPLFHSFYYMQCVVGSSLHERGAR